MAKATKKMTAADKPALKPIRTSRVSPEAEPQNEIVEPLSPAARVFHEPRLHCYIVARMGMRVSVDVERAKKEAIAKLLKHPRFSSKLAFDAEVGRPIGWVPTKVNVDDHFIAPDLDQNIEDPDKFVEDYTSNITKNDPIMDLSKPLWEFHILNVETSDCASTAIFRLHHSLGDGISIMSLILACSRKTSDPHALPSLPIAKEKKQIMNPYSYSGFLRYLFALFFIIKVLYYSLVDTALFAATVIFLKDTNTPLKSKGACKIIERTPSPRRFVHRNLSLDDIKLVKNAMDMTVNDVALGILQAGLSRYLNRKYGKDKAEKDDGKNLPKHIRLRAAVIVNRRQTTSIESLAEMMETGDFKGAQWGNVIGYIILPFHISLRDNPLDHIRNAKATIDRKKQSLESHLTYHTANLVLNMLGIEAACDLTYKAITNCTICFSNIVGPAEEISLAGYPVVYIAPTVYGLPVPLTIHFLSYMDKMTLSIAVDEDVIPDPHKLCDDIAESLELAKNAVCEMRTY